MLALNAKEDYFDDDTEEVPVKGGDDHAITIDVLDDMENFNGEKHQIITIETDELENSASITEEECIESCECWMLRWCTRQLNFGWNQPLYHNWSRWTGSFVT